MTDLIKLRKKMKNKKPDFVRQHAYKKKKLSKGWRAPKGMHSKMRRKLKSRRKQPSVGYSSPKAVRGFSKEGFKLVLVKTLKDLEKIKDEAIIIAKSVGLKKKLQLLEKIKQLKLKVVNVKEIDKFIKQAKESLEAKKKKKKQKQVKVVKKEKPKEKKETPKEKEKREKEEKRKVLEKK